MSFNLSFTYTMSKHDIVQQSNELQHIDLISLESLKFFLKYISIIVIFDDDFHQWSALDLHILYKLLIFLSIVNNVKWFSRLTVSDSFFFLDVHSFHSRSSSSIQFENHKCFFFDTNSIFIWSQSLYCTQFNIINIWLINEKYVCNLEFNIQYIIKKIHQIYHINISFFQCLLWIHCISISINQCWNFFLNTYSFILLSQEFKMSSLYNKYYEHAVHLLHRIKFIVFHWMHLQILNSCLHIHFICSIIVSKKKS